MDSFISWIGGKKTLRNKNLICEVLGCSVEDLYRSNSKQNT